MKKLIIFLFIFIFIFIYLDSIAQWVKTAGPFGGNIRELVVSNQRIFACLQNAGLFYSDDNCRHWNKMDTVFSSHPVFEGETPVCKAFPGVLIAGNGFSAPLISYNNGKSWVKTNDKTGFMSADRFAMLKDRIYSFGITGLFSIHVNDTVWRRDTALFDKNILGYNIAIIDTTVILISGSGVFLSQAFKNGWKKILPYYDHSISSRVIDYDTAFLIYIPSQGFTKFSLSGKREEFKPKGLEGVNLLGFASNNNRLFAYSFENKIYRSDDQGLDWILAGLAPAKTTISCLAFKSDTAILGTLSNGIFISKDLNKWEPMSDGLAGIKIFLCSFDDGVIGIGSNYLCVNYNNSNQWQSIGLPDSMYFNGGDVFGGEFLQSWCYFNKSFYIGTNLGLHATGDMGKTWKMISDTLNIYVIQADKNAMTIAETLKGVFQTHDNGNTWNCINPDMTGLDFGAIISSFLTTDKSILVATSGGLRRSFDKGKTWIYPEKNENTKFLVKNILNIVNIDESIFIAARLISGSGTDVVYVSENYGNSWENCSKNLPEFSIEGMVCNSNCLFFKTGKLLFFSKDKGKSWQSKMIDIPGKSLDFMAVNSSKLFISTPNGIWSCKIEDIIKR